MIKLSSPRLVPEVQSSGSRRLDVVARRRDVSPTLSFLLLLLPPLRRNAWERWWCSEVSAPPLDSPTSPGGRQQRQTLSVSRQHVSINKTISPTCVFRSSSWSDWKTKTQVGVRDISCVAACWVQVRADVTGGVIGCTSVAVRSPSTAVSVTSVWTHRVHLQSDTFTSLTQNA